MKKAILYLFLSFTSFLSAQKIPLEKAKMGAMIHLGLFSVLEGDYNGKDYGRDAGYWGADWIQINAKISKENYGDLIHQFNPKDFDAKQWVKFLKSCGVEYLIMMAKHHEGFALFHSKASDFHVGNSPYKKDIIKQLAKECKKQDLTFGVYYSHSKDWYHRENIRFEKNPSSKDYVHLVNAQLKELICHYDIDFILFNSGDEQKALNSSYYKLIKKENPNILVGGRVSGLKGDSDFQLKTYKGATKEKQEGLVLCPVTLRGSYSYDHDDHSWKTSEELTQKLKTTNKQNAKMIFNVGIHPNGTFTENDRELLKAVGNWKQKHKALFE